MEDWLNIKSFPGRCLQKTSNSHKKPVEQTNQFSIKVKFKILYYLEQNKFVNSCFNMRKGSSTGWRRESCFEIEYIKTFCV